MTTTTDLNSEVIRIAGCSYQIGAKGTVVEVAADGRLRVYWHTNPLSSTKPKRTWVAAKVVRIVEAG